jgi:hypothetical protein
LGYFLRVVQLGGERGAGHQDVAVAVQLGVDGLGEARGVAVVDVDLVLAGDLLERGHRHIDLVARVLGHVLDLAALDAARVVDDLHVVLDAGVDAHAREGEDARHGDGAADDDLLGALREHRQRVHERGAPAAAAPSIRNCGAGWKCVAGPCVSPSVGCVVA